MSLFDSYERECDHALNEAAKKISALTLGSSAYVSKDKISREVEVELERAKKAIDSMRQMSQNARASEGYGPRILQRETNLNRVRNDFDRALSGGRGGNDMFGGSGRQNDWDRQDRGLRDGMNQTRNVLDGTSSHLAETHRMAEQTHEIGVQTLEDLRRQREQLLNAQGGMSNIEDKTTGARKILGMMRRRVIGNKLILGFIIAILLTANFLIIYFTWIKKNDKSKSPAPKAPVAVSPPPVSPPPKTIPIAAPVAAPIAAPVARAFKSFFSFQLN